jgi:signal transduction histidine kinase
MRFLKDHNKSFRAYCLLYFFSALFLFSGVVSCTKKNTHDDAFFDKVVERANALYSGGREKEAVDFIDSVYYESTNVKPHYQYQRYLLKKLYYYYQKKYDSNVIYIDSMLYALEAGGVAEKYPSDYATALNAKGDFYFERNDLNKAFEYYYLSKRAAMSGKDSCALANQTYHLGMVTYKKEKYQDAIAYFHQASVENLACGQDAVSFNRNQELLNNIALCYTKLKKYDSALLFYSKALAINESGKKLGGIAPELSEIATGVIYGNVAKIFYARKQYDTAETLLRKNIAINSKPNFDNNDALLSMVQLAELYNENNKEHLLADLLSDIEARMQVIPNREVALRWRYLKYAYNFKKGNFREAAQYLQAYSSLKDSIAATDRAINQTDVPQFLKNLESEYELEILKRDNQLNRLYLTITISLSLLTLTIIALVYQGYRRSKKNVQVLTLLNNRINEQKDQLEFTMHELRKINRGKDRILNVVAHDLRNPIGGIMALSEMMLDNDFSEADKKSVQVIRATAENSLKLINKLLEVESERLKKDNSPKETTGMNELAQQVIELMQFQANEKRQKIVLKLPTEQVNVIAYKEKIWRVMSNLLSNALKFSPANSSVEVSVGQKEDMAIVAVKDTGIGIPEHLKHSIFDMFTSAGRSGTAGEKPVGLGLSICKQIIEDHNGKIYFDSKEGEGTTFYFELPLQQHKNEKE